MLDLDSVRWRSLEHAYGAAIDTPSLLRQLAEFPPDADSNAEPYFSLWSSLCHQGDVYSASYAAVPHIVRLIETSPERARWSALQLVVCIEVARAQGHGPEPEPDLAQNYRTALFRLPMVVAACSAQLGDELFARVAASAIAVSAGHTRLATAILELEPTLIPRFMEWIFEQ